MDNLTVTMSDGTTLPLAPANFDIAFHAKVAHDGVVLDLGIAYRMLLTERQWMRAKLDQLSTELADLKAARDAANR